MYDSAMPTRGAFIAVLSTNRDRPLAPFTTRLAKAIAVHDEAALVTECDDLSSECLRSADCILWVCHDSGQNLPLQAVDAKPGHRKELVILHEHRKSYTGTLDHADIAKAQLHHHIALDSDEDFARLARMLTGRGVGLVLSGGGARGFAHIGVIRALKEAGIPIDLVGGTSRGACIAAECALGWDYGTMLERNREAFVRLRPLRGYTIPFVSLLTGKRMLRALESLFDDVQIEDLPLNYFCVSSDLVRGELVVHRQGALSKYTRASTSVAGLAPPVPDRGMLLVDGGVLNNLPADVMRGFFRGTIIASDVNPYGYTTLASHDYGKSLSGWRVLRSTLNPFGQRPQFPMIHNILERVTMLGGIRHSNEFLSGVVDRYIRPPTDEFGFLEMKKLDAVADLGYRYASIEIEAWNNAC